MTRPIPAAREQLDLFGDASKVAPPPGGPAGPPPLSTMSRKPPVAPRTARSSGADEPPPPTDIYGGASDGGDGDDGSLADLARKRYLNYALSVITLRRLAQTDTTESMVFSFAVLLSVGAGLLAIPGWVPLQLSDWPYMLGVGLTGAIAQGLITTAFRHAPASVITPFEYTALVWGVILDLVIWHVLPSGVTLVGGSVVIGAGLYIIHRERTQAVK